MSEMSEYQVTKCDLESASKIFKDQILSNPNRIQTLINLAQNNNLNNIRELRPTAYKIFLNVIPKNENYSLENWINIIFNQRKEYKLKLNKFNTISDFKKIDDPLEISIIPNTEINCQKDPNSIIKIDLDRTNQSMEIFRENRTKIILSNVLFIWSKENEDVKYHQGMHELIAILFLILYPYYLKNSEKPKPEKEEVISYLNDIESNYKKIYLFFHDEDEIQADLFFLFNNLLSCEMKNLFEDNDIKETDKNFNLYHLFDDVNIKRKIEDRTNLINLRIALLIEEKLKLVDNRLYRHFKRISLYYNSFLFRWYKCIFAREFNKEDVFILWDKIFVYDYLHCDNHKFKYHLIYMDFICIAMLLRVRTQLINKDENKCFSVLFNMPEVEDISEILEISEKVREPIENKLMGEDYNFKDILKYIKDKYKEKYENINTEEETENINLRPHNYHQADSDYILMKNNKSEVCGREINKNIIYLIGAVVSVCILFYLFYEYKTKEDKI